MPPPRCNECACIVKFYTSHPWSYGGVKIHTRRLTRSPAWFRKTRSGSGKLQILGCRGLPWFTFCIVLALLGVPRDLDIPRCLTIAMKCGRHQENAGDYTEPFQQMQEAYEKLLEHVAPFLIFCQRLCVLLDGKRSGWACIYISIYLSIYLSIYTHMYMYI